MAKNLGNMGLRMLTLEEWREKNPPPPSDPLTPNERIRKALALLESEPVTVGIYSAICELRAALADGVDVPGEGQQ